MKKQCQKTKEALEKYLANGNFKGIGPATAKKIVNTFGEDTINVIKMEPQKLTQIKGISKEKSFGNSRTIYSKLGNMGKLLDS